MAQIEPTSATDEATVIELDGELTLETASGILASVLDQVAARPAPEVVLDLRGVTFCDSTGIGCLLTIRTALYRRGARMVLGPTSAVVAKMLTLAGVADRFD